MASVDGETRVWERVSLLPWLPKGCRLLVGNWLLREGSHPSPPVSSLSRGAGEGPREGYLGLEMAWGELSVMGKASPLGWTEAVHCGPWAGLCRLDSGH